MAPTWVAASTNWQTPSTIAINVNQSSEELYFAVSNNNWYPNGDPAGFLASLTDTDGTFVQTGTSTLVTNSANWQVLADNPLDSSRPIFFFIWY